MKSCHWQLFLYHLFTVNAEKTLNIKIALVNKYRSIKKDFSYKIKDNIR